MPIFPRYGGISTDISYDRAVEAPSDPRPKQIAQLGQATEQLGSALNTAAQRRQELEDVAEAQKRYMLMVTDMESMTEQLNVPDNAKQAKNLFGKFVSEREPEWTKGLNDRQSQLFQKQAFAKRLEYTVGAAKLENRAKLEDYEATMVKAENHYAQKASRIIDPSDGAESEEFQNFVRMGEAGVAAGYIKPDKWEEKKDKALKHGSYSRVYQVTASNSQEEIKRTLELYKQERDKEGSTFLKHIDPKERISLEKQLKERLHSLEHEDNRIKREQRADTEKMTAELARSTSTLASQKLADPAKYGTLTREWVDYAADLGLLDGKEHTYLRKEIEEMVRGGTPQTGGFGNAAVIGRYSIEVFDTSTPAQAAALKERLKSDIVAGNVPAGPGSVGSQWVRYLSEKASGGSGGAPTLQQQTDDIKSLLKTELRVTGPMAAMNDSERAVMGEAVKALDMNARNGYQKDPWQIYEENIDKWQARIGQPGKFKANELRRSNGMPPRQKAGTADETLEKHRIMLQDQFKAATPGPEGDALRASIREAARSLRRLQQLEQTLDYYETQRGQSRAARQEQKQQQSGGAPLAGPRR